MASCPSYSLASIKPPLRGLAFPPLAALPPMPPPSSLAPPLRCPPLRGFPPYARRCRAATLDPRSAARRSGIAAPASATAPPLTRLGAACAGGGCPRRWRGCGWNSLAVRSLALRLGRCPRRPRGPVPFGQSGPREDRRGSSRRSAALFRPAGFGWGRARLPCPNGCFCWFFPRAPATVRPTTCRCTENEHSLRGSGISARSH